MLEKIKVFGETLQIYVIIVSIFVAGWWTYSTFILVHQNEINKEPNLLANISVTPIVHGEEKYIKAIVTVENIGNDSVWLDLGVDSFTVNKVNFDENLADNYTSVSKKSYKAYIDNTMLQLGDIKELIISPKTDYRFAYATKIDSGDSGLFHVSFLASQRHLSARNTLLKKGYKEDTVLSIQASDFVYVK
jgi:hypothetical protein